MPAKSSIPNRDPWLSRWLPLVHERSGGRPILELGCGSGEDTATLVGDGLSVVGIDLSASAIERARGLVPGATFFVQDLRAPFPAAADPAGVIVASLSLHYFGWAETVSLVERIRRTLQPRGVLLCRLNSTRDSAFGATGYPQLEENYYLVEGNPKRFFDRAAVDALFAGGWRQLSARELVIDRYEKPKVAWEIILEQGA